MSANTVIVDSRLEDVTERRTWNSGFLWPRLRWASFDFVLFITILLLFCRAVTHINSRDFVDRAAEMRWRKHHVVADGINHALKSCSRVVVRVMNDYTAYPSRIHKICLCMFDCAVRCWLHVRPLCGLTVGSFCVFCWKQSLITNDHVVKEVYR